MCGASSRGCHQPISPHMTRSHKNRWSRCSTWWRYKLMFQYLMRNISECKLWTCFEQIPSVALITTFAQVRRSSEGLSTWFILFICKWIPKSELRSILLRLTKKVQKSWLTYLNKLAMKGRLLITNSFRNHLWKIIS